MRKLVVTDTPLDAAASAPWALRALRGAASATVWLQVSG